MRLVQTTGKIVGDAVASPVTYNFATALKPGTCCLLTTTHFAPGSARITGITFSGTAGARDSDRTDVGNAATNHADIWRANNVAGNSTAIQLTSAASTNNYWSLSAEEWQGVLVGNPLDQVGSTGDTTSNAPSATAAGATSQDDELAYGTFTDYAGSNWVGATAPSGGTLTFVEPDGTAHEAGAGAYKVLTAIGTPAMTFGTTNSMSWIAAMATYKVYGPGHQFGVVKLGVGGTSSLTTGAWNSATTPGLVLAGIGRGAISDNGSGSVSDNKSNTYSWLTIGGSTTHSYSPEWPTSGTAIYASQANPTGGSGHTVTANRTTSGDEVTVLAVETPAGFNSIVDSSWVYAASGANTSASVTTTGPAWLYCFWWGADTSGEENPVPGAGWYKLEWTSDLTSNHVQGGVFARYEPSAGTFTCTVTPGTAQKAQMYLIAVQAGGGGGPTINTQPVQQTGAVGGTATFSVAATTSGGTLTYQWRELIAGTMTNISGETAASYTTGTLSSADNGKVIDVVVSDDNGTIGSAKVGLYISGLPVTGKGRYFTGWAKR